MALKDGSERRFDTILTSATKEIWWDAIKHYRPELVPEFLTDEEARKDAMLKLDLKEVQAFNKTSGKIDPRGWTG